MTTKRPPRGLDSRAKALWTALNDRWNFSPDELEVLRLAVEAVDRAEKAQKLLDAEGLVIEGRYGPKEHPAVAIRTAAEGSAARLLKQIGFKNADDPARKSAAALAQERWSK